MSDKILHKRSLTPGSLPTTSSLEVGELAINVADGKIHLRRSGSGNDNILSLVTADTITTGSITATSFSGSFSGSGADLSNIPASAITGLNLSQIATGSIVAAVNVNSASFSVTSGSSTFLFVSSSGNVGIGTPSTSTSRLFVKGAGSTSATRAFTAENLAGNGRVYFGNDRAFVVEINDTGGPIHTMFANGSNPTYQFGTTTVQGTIRALNGGEVQFSDSAGAILSSTGVRINTRGNLHLEGNTGIVFYTNGTLASMTERARITNSGLGIGRIPTSSLDVAGTTRLSGSFNTATSGSILTVIGSGSAQPIFTVQGSQGELFSVTDSLSGSLFSVNNVSGLPILEAFSDDTVVLGSYLAPALNTTVRNTLTNSGSFTVYNIPTASYDAAFFEYSVKSGSNARAGNIMATFAGTTTSFTEVTTADIGSTSGLTFGVLISGSNMVLTGSASTSNWVIKTIVRSI